MLEAYNLKKVYKNRAVVKDVSLLVSPKEIVGLLGPNGAGKTTVFYMIVGLVAPDNGSIIIDEQESTKNSIHKRALMGLGYLPQEASVFRKLTVEQNIKSVLQINTNLKSAAKKARLEELLEEFSLSHIRKNLGMSLSGGERRRVEIARALAADPKYILLDEPFAGVDPISVIEIKQIIKKLKNLGLGVLITDHNVRETLDVCDIAYIVSAGEIIAKGLPAEVAENEKVKEVYLGDDFAL